MPNKIAQLESQLIRAALDAAHVGLLVVDSTSHLVLVSDHAQTVLRRDARELLGQPYQMVLGTGLNLARFREVFAVDAPEIACEGRIARAGSETLLLFQARTFRAADGELFRSVAIIDLANYGVTRDQFIALRRQLDNMNTAVVITDARQPDHPIVHVNAAFERTTGYSAREAIGRNCRFLQRSDREQPELRELKKAMEQHSSCHVVLRNYRRDGSTFLNELLISPMFDEHGELSHFIGIQRVVSGRMAPIYEHKEHA